MEKMGNIHDEMGNFHQERETVKKNQVEMLEMKTITIEIKNACNGHISRLEIARERISKFKDRSIEITQTETQRRKELQKKKK